MMNHGYIPRPSPEEIRTVSEDIKRVLGSHHLNRAGIEFLVAMGLLVKDPAARAVRLREALILAIAALRYPSDRAKENEHVRAAQSRHRWTTGR